MLRGSEAGLFPFFDSFGGVFDEEFLIIFELGGEGFACGIFFAYEFEGASARGRIVVGVLDDGFCDIEGPFFLDARGFFLPVEVLERGGHEAGLDLSGFGFLFDEGQQGIPLTCASAS